MRLQLGRRGLWLEDDKSVNGHLSSICDAQSLCWKLKVGKDKTKVILRSKLNTLGNYFVLKLQSDKSYLLRRSILNTENISTQLKVKHTLGKIRSFATITS